MRQLFDSGLFADKSVVKRSKDMDLNVNEILDDKSFVRETLNLDLPNSNMGFTDGRFLLGYKNGKDYTFGMTRSALNKILNVIKVPTDFFINSPRELAIHNFDKTKVRGGSVIAEFDNTGDLPVITNIFSNEASLAKLDDVLANIDGPFGEIMVNDDSFRVLKKSSLEFGLVKPGEQHFLSLYIDGINKFNGFNCSAKSGLMRLACTNGMVVPDNLFADLNKNIKFSAKQYKKSESSIEGFLEIVSRLDLSELSVKLQEAMNNSLETYPTNNLLLDTYKTCRKEVNVEFADMVIEWDSDTKKDFISRSKIKKDHAIWKNEIENSFGTRFEIANRITDGVKPYDIEAQMALQEFAGVLTLS